MPTPLITQLVSRHGVPRLDAGSIDRFIAPEPGAGDATILFFTGDPVRWPEANDVAVVLPELLAAFAGRVRGGLIAREAEAALMPRFGVKVFPSLALVREGRTLGVIPKIQDWSNYVARIARLLDAAEGAAAIRGANA